VLFNKLLSKKHLFRQKSLILSESSRTPRFEDKGFLKDLQQELQEPPQEGAGDDMLDEILKPEPMGLLIKSIFIGFTRLKRSFSIR